MNWEERFKENICKYCDNNIKEKVLFTLFMYLSPQLEKETAPKDLAILTSKIVNDLIAQKIIIEIPKKSDNPYGLYEIQSHENLWNK